VDREASPGLSPPPLLEEAEEQSPLSLSFLGMSGRQKIFLPFAPACHPLSLSFVFLEILSKAHCLHARILSIKPLLHFSTGADTMCPREDSARCFSHSLVDAFFFPVRGSDHLFFFFYEMSSLRCKSSAPNYPPLLGKAMKCPPRDPPMVVFFHSIHTVFVRSRSLQRLSSRCQLMKAAQGVALSSGRHVHCPLC